MSSDHPWKSLSTSSYDQRARLRSSKSRPVSKKYRKSYAFQNTTCCNFLSDVQRAITEPDDLYKSEKVFLDANGNEKKKPSQYRFSPMTRSPPSQTPFPAFRSTLANLSDALATLNEGEYLRWGNWSPPRTPFETIRPIKKTERPAPLIKLQTPPLQQSGHNYSQSYIDSGRNDSMIKHNEERSSMSIKVRESMETRKSMDGTIRKENNESTRSSIVRLSPRDDVKSSKTKLQGILGVDSRVEEQDEGSRSDTKRNKSIDSSYCVMQPIEQKSASLAQIYNQSLAPRRTELHVDTMMKKKEVKRAEETGHELKKEDWKLPKLTFGDEKAIPMMSQGMGRDKVRLREIVGEMSKTHVKGGLVGQWRAGRTLAGFKVKSRKSSVILKSKSISKILKEDARAEQSQGYDPSPIHYTYEEQDTEPSEVWNMGDIRIQGNMSRGALGEGIPMTRAERILVDDIAHYTEEFTATLQTEADQPKQGCYKIGYFPMLTPTLKKKKDYVLRKPSLGTPGIRKDLLRQGVIKDGEDLEKTRMNKSKRMSQQMSMNGYEVKKGEEADIIENTKARMVFEERMKMLEQKYIKNQDVIEKGNEEVAVHKAEEVGHVMNKQRPHVKEESPKKRRAQLMLVSNEAQRKLNLKSLGRKLVK